MTPPPPPIFQSPPSAPLINHRSLPPHPGHNFSFHHNRQPPLLPLPTLNPQTRTLSCPPPTTTTTTTNSNYKTKSNKAKKKSKKTPRHAVNKVPPPPDAGLPPKRQHLPADGSDVVVSPHPSCLPLPTFSLRAPSPARLVNS
ncbi:unnamed protein product [Cuscuta campestris]|uniref:Uncharacterized protein n=1 Tax=Cuscuta campestris TaxID=132261 RepID=A0A484LKE8_9ASTE|nr:unnamed protein product [Cuscuta campestris]